MQAQASTLRSRPTTTGPTASTTATPSVASTAATRASTSATGPTAATTSTTSASSTAAPSNCHLHHHRCLLHYPGHPCPCCCGASY
ncbi:unnamed protein product [Closterium sp. NIES-54]